LAIRKPGRWKNYLAKWLLGHKDIPSKGFGIERMKKFSGFASAGLKTGLVCHDIDLGEENEKEWFVGTQKK
jgi:hypothetical protein